MKLADILSGTNGDGLPATPLRRRALAYARVSTDDQERAGQSIPAQIKDIERYAQTHDVEILEVYRESESAFAAEGRRPVFWRMVERAKGDSSITGILVHDHSRFFRDPYAGPQVKGDLLAHGVQVISATEPVFDPRTIAGLAVDKMTEFKNASYSLDTRFHTLKGMRENVGRRDAEIGYCYKNGGAAPWGFKAYKVDRGANRRGEPIRKSLWTRDETIVAGRPVWEWTRHILIDLRVGQRASIQSIRDFLNETGIPAPRKSHWGTSSIHALLQPSILLQYAGRGVWNVHGPHGRHNPSSDWVIVENAHPEIISLDEAEAVLAVNQELGMTGSDHSKARMAQVRTQGSRYLLSGDLMVCKRCGANMVGYRNRGRLYYVCGAKAYRRGFGCGPALQIRKEEIEEAVLEEVGRLFNSWTDTKQLMGLVNEELQALHQQQAAESIELTRELARVDQELENLRKAIRGGLDDIDWANGELRRLRTERGSLEERLSALGPEPEVLQLDLARVEEYRHRLAEVFAQGTNEERRAYARFFVKRIEVDPDTADVWMFLYGRPPTVVTPGNPPKAIRASARKAKAPVRIGLVAGARYTAEKKKTTRDADEIDELLRLVFEPDRISLIPA